MAEASAFKAHRKAIVKDVDAKQGLVTVYGSAFGNEDSDGDIIELLDTIETRVVA